MFRRYDYASSDSLRVSDTLGDLIVSTRYEGRFTLAVIAGYIGMRGGISVSDLILLYQYWVVDNHSNRGCRDLAPLFLKMPRRILEDSQRSDLLRPYLPCLSRRLEQQYYSDKAMRSEIKKTLQNPRKL